MGAEISLCPVGQVLCPINPIAKESNVSKNLLSDTKRSALTYAEFARYLFDLLLKEARVTRELAKNHHVAKETNLAKTFIRNKKELESLRWLEWVIRVLLVIKLYPLIKRQRSATSNMRCLIWNGIVALTVVWMRGDE